MPSAPQISDSPNTLWFKICAELSDRNGGAYAPSYRDPTHRLIWKVAQLIFTYGL